MSEKRVSIQPTHDQRETGPRYTVTTKLDGKPLAWQKPISDPFTHTTVRIGWRDCLRGLLHRALTVEVTVSGDPRIVEDVLELDDNYLGWNCTRRDHFNEGINEALEKFEFGEQ